MIGNEKGRLLINKIVTISKHNKFIVAGKRIILFELDTNSSLRDLYFGAKPISVEFNSYYMQFIVLTKFDIRIYDCATGKLKKIYSDLNGDVESEYSSLVLDHRSRIFIVGDSSGALNSYNYANGQLIKSIRQSPDENQQTVNKDNKKSKGKSSGIQHGNQFFSEISAMHYCNEDKILIAAS